MIYLDAAACWKKLILCSAERGDSSKGKVWTEGKLEELRGRSALSRAHRVGPPAVHRRRSTKRNEVRVKRDDSALSKQSQ